MDFALLRVLSNDNELRDGRFWSLNSIWLEEREFDPIERVDNAGREDNVNCLTVLNELDPIDKLVRLCKSLTSNWFMKLNELEWIVIVFTLVIRVKSKFKRELKLPEPTVMFVKEAEFNMNWVVVTKEFLWTIICFKEVDSISTYNEEKPEGNTRDTMERWRSLTDFAWQIEELSESTFKEGRSSNVNDNLEDIKEPDSTVTFTKDGSDTSEMSEIEVKLFLPIITFSSLSTFDKVNKVLSANVLFIKDNSLREEHESITNDDEDMPDGKTSLSKDWRFFSIIDNAWSINPPHESVDNEERSSKRRVNEEEVSEFNSTENVVSDGREMSDR